MAAITQFITTYSGTLPNPDTQGQPEYDDAAYAFTLWLLGLVPEINTNGEQANALWAAVNVAAADAEAARDTTLAYRDSAQIYRDQSLSYRDAAQLYAGSASAGAGTAQTAQVAAEAAALEAQGYAALAQATNPDAPIRYNTNTITSDITLPAGHNGISAGPLQISTDINVTVTRNSAWSIA